VNVSLPSPLEDFVRRKVAVGDFESVDEVVCEGLRLLQQQEAWSAEARRKIDIGWEQAKSGQLHTPEQTRENLAARKETWKRDKGR
jgi:putative addiction module CopG family antidote